jgi:hypothetical protein
MRTLRGVFLDVRGTVNPIHVFVDYRILPRFCALLEITDHRAFHTTR